MRLFYPYELPIPKNKGEIIVFRNKKDGYRYYKRYDTVTVRLINDGNGETYKINEKALNSIASYTDEKAELFYTDEGTFITFQSNVSAQNARIAVGAVAGIPGPQGAQGAQGPAGADPTPGGDAFAPFFDYYTDATTVSNTETDLYTGAIAANTLNINGKKILAVYAGEGAAGGATYTYRVYFGSSIIANINTLSESDWNIEVTMIRSGATTARVLVTFHNSAANVITQTDVAALNFGINNTLLLTGQVANAAGSITAKMGYVTYMPNA